MIDWLTGPFAEFDFMKRALIAALALAVSGAPLGVFMTLRRMTLAGDALSHAVLPGIAVAALLAGSALWALTLGGIAAALVLAACAAALTRWTRLKEDEAFGMIALVSLAGGVCLLTMKGSSAALMHLLFGNILAIDPPTLTLITGAAGVTLLAVAALYRRLVIAGFDPDFLRLGSGARGGASATDLIFFSLVMAYLVVAFQALGTLMALGLMILPALASRFWAETIDALLPIAAGLAALSALCGLLLSFHMGWPSGPAIVLVAGAAAALSALMGRIGSVRVRIIQCAR